MHEVHAAVYDGYRLSGSGIFLAVVVEIICISVAALAEKQNCNERYYYYKDFLLHIQINQKRRKFNEKRVKCHLQNVHFCIAMPIFVHFANIFEYST